MAPPTKLPPTPTLRTPRLILRPIRLADADAVQRLFPHWEIVRHLQAGVPWPFPDDGALIHLRAELQAMAEGLKNVWAIVQATAPDDLIGFINLRIAPPGEDNRGFWLATRWHGRGLMTEAANAVTAYAFDTLNWPSLTVSNAEPNEPSRRLKLRQGAVFVARSPGRWVGGDGVKETWRIDRDRWRSAMGDRGA